MNKQMKIGAIISYFNIVLNMVVSVFLTPFLISSLGSAEYGVYRIIQSFAGQLSIASFGISTLIIRNIVYFNEKKQQKEKENFLFFAKIITFALALLILLVGGIMHGSLDVIYAKSMSAGELELAKQLFIFLVVNIALNIVCDSYTGLITAHEKFAVANFSKTIKLTLRIILIVVLLKMGVKSIGIVVTDCVVSAIVFVIVFIYGKIKVKEKAKFHYFDKPLLIQCVTFSFAIFLQTIINQVNQNLDNVILGAMTDPETVTLYSVGLSLFITYSTFVTAIGSLFGPKATKLVANNASGEEMTDFVIVPGRLQFMLAGLIITGFILFGKNFISIWVGDEFMSAYYITLMLIIPGTIPFIETTTESLLNAKMKRLGRSLILIFMCLVNVVVSVICIKQFGYWGAAIGTMTSYIVGYGIFINLYLKKTLDLNIKRLFLSVFKGVLLSMVISGVIGIPLTFLPDSFIWFVMKVGIYTVMYATITYFLATNEEEKQLFKKLIKFRKKDT